MADIVFRDNREQVEKELKSMFDIGMEAVATQAEANAKREVTTLVYDTPPSPHYVRTGDLRNSIAHYYDKETQTAYVGSLIKYAPYVELGTVKMAARPFLKNAVEKYADQYKRILSEALK